MYSMESEVFSKNVARFARKVVKLDFSSNFKQCTEMNNRLSIFSVFSTVHCIARKEWMVT